MKIKAILSLCMIAILLISVMTFSVSAAEKLTANVKKGTPVIDGVADEIWNHVDEIKIGKIKNSGDSPNDGSGVTGSFKLLWDDSNLYVIVFVNDSTRFNTGAASHQQDSVEIFLDPLNTITDTYDDDDFRFCIAADGAVSTNGQEGNVTYKVVDSGNSYVVEMAIAIKGAVPSFKFESGTTFGWDVQLNDSDTGAEVRNHCLGWNDEANEVWQNPTYMGTLILSADEAAPVVTEEVVEAPAENAETVPAPVEKPKAPQTNDNLIIFAGMIMLALATFVTVRKVRKN